MDIFNNTEKILEKYGQKIIDFIPNLVISILILLVGLWLIRTVNKIVRNFFERKDYDPTLEKFIASLINYGLKIVLFVIVVTKLGVESASLVAVIGSAGLAIGLALQGSLSNFAGGVLILLLRPFKVGDFISGQGVEGTVKEISIFNTKLNTFGNQLAVIPNGKLSNDTIINYTEEGLRRENIIFGIAYDADIKLAKEILLALVHEQETVIQLEDKEPMVVVSALADSSVHLSIRYWAHIDDFWNLRFLILEEGKSRIEAAGIVIPFPQRDIHVYQKN